MTRARVPVCDPSAPMLAACRFFLTLEAFIQGGDRFPVRFAIASVVKDPERADEQELHVFEERRRSTFNFVADELRNPRERENRRVQGNGGDRSAPFQAHHHCYYHPKCGRHYQTRPHSQPPIERKGYEA